MPDMYQSLSHSRWNCKSHVPLQNKPPRGVNRDEGTQQKPPDCNVQPGIPLEVHASYLRLERDMFRQ
jgi:hypothetical protein